MFVDGGEEGLDSSWCVDRRELSLEGDGEVYSNVNASPEQSTNR